MFVLYIPVLNNHELTRECLGYLAETTVDKANFTVLVIDNASDVPYDMKEFEGLDLHIELIRNEENLSGYLTINQAREWLDKRFPPNLFFPTTSNLIGFMHNDVFVYEKGWDLRVTQSFQNDPKLGLIGFCGSDEVCDRGGRGGGTMCNFDGRKGQKQQNTGKKVTGLHAAVLLDSLTMIFRADVLSTLHVDESIAPAHFYDKIWTMRLVDAGFHVCVLGIQIDHLGGMTSVGVPKYNEAAAKWCKKYGIPFDEANLGTAGHAVYLEAERRMFVEFAPKGMIPCRVDANHSLTRIPGRANFPATFHW